MNTHIGRNASSLHLCNVAVMSRKAANRTGAAQAGAAAGNRISKRIAPCAEEAVMVP